MRRGFTPIIRAGRATRLYGCAHRKAAWPAPLPEIARLRIPSARTQVELPAGGTQARPKRRRRFGWRRQPPAAWCQVITGLAAARWTRAGRKPDAHFIAG